MKIKQKLNFSFMGSLVVLAVVGVFSIILSKEVTALRTIELPMEQNVREVEVSIWEMIQAADSFRLGGQQYYEDLYHKQINDVEEYFSKYQALIDTEDEKRYVEEFYVIWKAAQVAGDKMIEFTKQQKAAEQEFFVNVDEADDVIDFAIQAKWSTDDPDILAKEQAVREVEVSIWEAIHAAQQYIGLAGEIVRGGQKYVGDEVVAGKAAAKASLVKGDFENLMEAQFQDVEEFWGKYKALPLEEFEKIAIEKFDQFWAKAVVSGRECIFLHKQAEEQFDILYQKIDETDNLIDFKIQKFIEERIRQHDVVAKRFKVLTTVIVCCAFIIILIVGWGISFSISSSIVRLRDAVGEIRKGKLKSTKVEVRSEDEMGFLAESFNEMVCQLAASEQQLKASEQQLKASNQQLKASNQQLQINEESLIKAQENLKKQLADLQLFQEVTIGREITMLDLKKEVNRLLKESGKEPKYEEIE